MLERATLRSQELCERAQVTYKQVDYWTRNQLLEPIGHPTPGYGTRREYAETEVAVARFLDLVVPWCAPASRLTRARVRIISERIRDGIRGTVQLVDGVTVDLDVICGSA